MPRAVLFALIVAVPCAYRVACDCGGESTVSSICEADSGIDAGACDGGPACTGPGDSGVGGGGVGMCDGGLFSPPTSWSTGAGSYFIAVADLDRDGKLDLAIPNSNADTISLRYNDGDGGFGRSQLLPTGVSPSEPYTTSVADLDGDGWMDLVIADNQQVAVLVWFGEADGGYSKMTLDAGATAGTKAAVVGDFDGDGDPDVAATGPNGDAVVMFRNLGGRSLAFWQQIAVPGSPRAMVVGDLNGDGQLDLAISTYSQSVRTLLNSAGGGTFTLGGPYGGVGYGENGALGDLTGSGRLDVAFCGNSSDAIEALANDGGGGFSVIGDYPLIACHGAAVGDVDGDGRVDLVAAGQSSPDPNLGVILNQGGAGFAAPFHLVDSGMSNDAVAVADLNGDGRLDVIANDGNSVSVRVYLNRCAPPAPTCIPMGGVCAADGGIGCCSHGACVRNQCP